MMNKHRTQKFLMLFTTLLVSAHAPIYSAQEAQRPQSTFNNFQQLMRYIKAKKTSTEFEKFVTDHPDLLTKTWNSFTESERAGTRFPTATFDTGSTPLYFSLTRLCAIIGDSSIALYMLKQQNASSFVNIVNKANSATTAGDQVPLSRVMNKLVRKKYAYDLLKALLAAGADITKCTDLSKNELACLHSISDDIRNNGCSGKAALQALQENLQEAAEEESKKDAAENN